MKLKYEIVGALTLIFLVAIIGQSTLFSVVRNNQELLVDSLQESKLTLSNAHGLHRAYQNHIQSWKNILLRGHLPEQYHFYLEQFYQYDRDFKRQIRTLQKAFPEQSPIAQTLEEVTRIHLSVAKGYRATLDAYAQATDTPQNLSVMYVNEEIAIDGLLTRLTEDIAEKQIAQLRNSNDDNNWILDSTWYSTLIVAAVGLLVLYLLLSKRIVEPIERTVLLANRIQKGETSLRLESSGNRDFVSFAQAFNSMLDGLEVQNERLEHAANQMAESEKLAALGGLVAGVAHELNTPIGVGLTASTSIHDTVKYLKKQLESQQLRKSEMNALLGDVDEFCALLEKNILRASELIRNFKQVAVDQTSERKRQFNLDVYIEEVLSTVKPKVKHTDYVIKTQVESLELDSYPGPLAQLLTNLIENSIAHGFRNKDSGTIYIEAKATADQKVFLIYEDDGSGLTDEVKERIFDPFYTTAADRMGSGLGMNIVYNIVTRLLGGTIRIESELNRFTRFSIVFPLTSPEKAASEIYATNA